MGKKIRSSTLNLILHEVYRPALKNRGLELEEADEHATYLVGTERGWPEMSFAIVKRDGASRRFWTVFVNLENFDKKKLMADIEAAVHWYTGTYTEGWAGEHEQEEQRADGPS